MAKWMVLIRENGDKHADYEIIIEQVNRRQALKAMKQHCEIHGYAYRLGYKFDDGEQQICFTDGYDGSPVLGKIIRYTNEQQLLHSFPGARMR